MKKLNSAINRFCYRHPHFGIQNLMKYIVIGNIVFWLIGAINPVLYNYLAFSPRLILRGQIWRLVSFVFFPNETGIFALIEFYFFYWIGNTLEQYWGTTRFNIFFFMGVILTIIFDFVLYFITGVSYQITAVYIFLSMFFAFAALFPDMQVLFMFIIPVKMKWLAILDALLFVRGVLTMSFPINLLPVVAVLNFVLFCGEDLLKLFPRRQTKSTINFRKESARIRREQSDRLYRHKCSVCGKTDTDYPNLEFRYCSRCQGYHCFCEEHINSHIHFTE